MGATRVLRNHLNIKTMLVLGPDERSAGFRINTNNDGPENRVAEVTAHFFLSHSLKLI